MIALARQALTYATPENENTAFGQVRGNTEIIHQFYLFAKSLGFEFVLPLNRSRFDSLRRGLAPKVADCVGHRS